MYEYSHSKIQSIHAELCFFQCWTLLERGWNAAGWQFPPGALDCLVCTRSLWCFKGGLMEPDVRSVIWMFQKLRYPQIINSNRVFPYKPSILGYHYFGKHPYAGILRILTHTGISREIACMRSIVFHGSLVRSSGCQWSPPSFARWQSMILELDLIDVKSLNLPWSYELWSKFPKINLKNYRCL